ncbi:MAG: DUF423 domain-containing protein [Cyclobacteriaceae bacterium]|nr:DUF423 domain-containing protein [Cyclobacteriaceae bacterium]
MNKKILALAALAGGLAVALGAFGAHGLQEVLLANGRADTYHTAVTYHMFHALALLVLAVGEIPGQKITAGLLTGGILVFSGSLYLLSVTNLTWLGAITPLGGFMFMAGWGWLFFQSIKKN